MNSRLPFPKLSFLVVIFLPVLLLLTACTQQTIEKDTEVPKEPTQKSEGKATLVLKNGSVYTMEEDQHTAEAIAINDDQIIFVGSNTGVEKYISDDTQVIDLKGKMVSTGFMDGHTHPPGQWTTKLFQVDLTNVKSHEEYIQAIADFRKDHPDVKIITGRGWKNGSYEQEDGTNPGPKKEDIDVVVSDIPVILNSIDGHSVWVNSKALAMAGISKETKAPKAGMIERNPDG